MDSENGLSRRFDKYGMPLWHSPQIDRWAVASKVTAVASIKRIPVGLKCAINTALEEPCDEILKRYQPLLKKKIVTLGHDHPDTCNTRNIVAYIFLKRKMYDKAFMLHYQIKSAFEDRFYLILELYYEGEFEKALRFIQRIYDHMKQIAYKVDLKSLKLRTLVGHIYSAMNKYKDALKIYEDVYRIYFHLQGEDHPDALSVQRRIGVILRSKGNYTDAMRSFVEVLNKRRKKLGDDHEDTVVSRKDIAELLIEFGTYERPLKIYKEVYDIENKVRPDQPATLDTKCGIAKVLCIKYKFDEAIKLLSEVFEVQKRNKRYIDVRATMHYVARVLTGQKEYREALNVYLKLYETQKVPMHQDTLDVEKNIAVLLAKLKEYDDALDIFLCLHSKLSKLLGTNHTKILDIQTNVGLIFTEKEEYSRALKIFKDVYEIQAQEDFLGPDHPDTMRTTLKIAEVHYRQKRFIEAQQIYQRVLDKMLLVFKTDNAEILQIRCNVARIYRQQGQLNFSFQNYYQIYEIRVRVLGEKHPDTLSVEKILDEMAKDLPSTNLLLSANNNDLNGVQLSCILTTKFINDRDIDGSTALHLASKKGFEEIVKFLLEKGAIFNLKNRQGKKPKDLAATDPIKILFESAEDSFKAVENGDYQHFVDLITKTPSIINAKDTEGCTLLHWASSMGRKKFVNFLLEAGADFKLVTNNGNTALHLAISKGCGDSAELLLKYIKSHGDKVLKSFVNTKTDTLGTTCLHIAAQNNFPYCTQLLLDHGADTKIRNKFGKIPVELTAHYHIRMALTDRSFRI